MFAVFIDDEEKRVEYCDSFATALRLLRENNGLLIRDVRGQVVFQRMHRYAVMDECRPVPVCYSTDSREEAVSFCIDAMGVAPTSRYLVVDMHTGEQVSELSESS